MKTPHKHAELIKAWADGAEIQFQNCFGHWFDCEDNPRWVDSVNYRIKPEPKPDVVRFGCFYEYANSAQQELRLYNVQQQGIYPNTAQLKLTFDGETGKLKSAEVV